MKQLGNAWGLRSDPGQGLQGRWGVRESLEGFLAQGLWAQGPEKPEL